ncbi:hypothetical protein [Bifidobacterium breve]|uniref:hypothetical protein n=1 Tax=Bifidobacterium breve TaxID=1685 RepID=UPI0018E3A739|nr:hypothetical protein [Bifidobacterium breve]MCZ4465271.1 hypothetical protein [Bifidobacterium breve]MCZ4467610.1 hypothetical protein [Bifidobacterium breve]MCZ4471365.1 hypothetical protein [Bifidobacterium breve]
MQPVELGGNFGIVHGDDAAAIGVVDLLDGERIAGVTGITVKAGATVQVIDRNPDKAAAAAAEGVTNQTPWTGGFKVVK